MRTGIIVALAALAAAGWVGYRHTQVRRAAPELRTPALYLQRPIIGPISLRHARRRAEPTEPLPGVRVRHRSIPGAGSVSIPVTIYADEQGPPPLGALLWIHGGGRIAGRAELDHRLCSVLCRRAEVIVVSVDYRLAPEHPFPAALEDVHAAMRWLQGAKETLEFDPARIAVGGASAGGGLAAELCQLAHDEGDPAAFQLLVYPMLDHLTRRPDSGRGRLSWSAASNRYAWRSYLGIDTDDPPAYSVAARREDLSGLPPAWIGVGDLDLFYQEDVAYAERLQAAGVPVHLEVVPRMYHAADLMLKEQAESMTRFWEGMADALREGLSTRS